jgi:ribosomal protein S18 acetylase RimI-like enzyme
MTMHSKVIIADYANPQQANDLVMLLEHYALDPMRGNKPLAASVKQNLASELAKIPNAISILCYVNNNAAGLLNCFQGFSTFKCKPLINIHDVIVHSQYRGQGLSTQMLDVVEQLAIDRGCCKLTLEVLTENTLAKHAYTKFGFNPYQIGAENGHALFLEKPL